MIAVKKMLVPIGGMEFDNIYSFETECHIGIWNHFDEKFVLMPRSDIEFNAYTLKRCSSLEELDDAVYEQCEEHISGVSGSQDYEFAIIE